MINKTFKFFIILIFLTTIFGCSQTKDTTIQTQNETKLIPDKIIVTFGDSLTEGLGVSRDEAYPAQLEQALKEKEYNIKVYNSGLSGETTSGALARVDWVLKLNPDIVILGIGANDAMRGIDLDLTDENIRKIIKKLKENNVKIILSGQIIFQNLGTDYMNKFENIYPKIAQDENLIFIPNFLEGVATNQSLNNNDQIHPNKQGYEIIVRDNVLPKVLEALK